MTQLDKEKIRKQLIKTAALLIQECKFRNRVMLLGIKDAEDTFQRFKIISDAIDDIDNFDFDKEGNNG